jgi:hypothetical protein
VKQLCVTVMILALGGLCLAYDEEPIPIDRVVTKAEAVGIARVVKVTVTEGRCESNTKVYLSPVSYLKGSLPKSEVVFSYTYYHWKRARWPWQTECPSVNYSLPPIAEGMKEGDEVLFAASFFPDRNDHFVIGTMKIHQMERVRRLLEMK